MQLWFCHSSVLKNMLKFLSFSVHTFQRIHKTSIIFMHYFMVAFISTSTWNSHATDQELYSSNGSCLGFPWAVVFLRWCFPIPLQHLIFEFPQVIVFPIGVYSFPRNTDYHGNRETKKIQRNETVAHIMAFNDWMCEWWIVKMWMALVA